LAPAAKTHPNPTESSQDFVSAGRLLGLIAAKKRLLGRGGPNVFREMFVVSMLGLCRDYVFGYSADLKKFAGLSCQMLGYCYESL